MKKAVSIECLHPVTVGANRLGDLGASEKAGHFGSLELLRLTGGQGRPAVVVMAGDAPDPEDGLVPF